jgi:hypothetical protein
MNPIKFAFSVERCHPWISQTPLEEDCFIALQQVIAKQPSRLFNLKDDDCIRFIDPKNGQIFIITLQE